MKRVITSFEKAKKDLLKVITEEFPNGINEDSLIKFPTANGGSIRAVEITIDDTIYLVRMHDENYYQKYMAFEESDEANDNETSVNEDDYNDELLEGD